MSSAADKDTGIRITLTPTQSSYFAGEPFSVTVTFTNTHSPVSSSGLPTTDSIGYSTSKKGHKRAVHSISSAPISRPPTSPGISSPRANKDKSLGKASADASTKRRKGLIGPPLAVHEHNEELVRPLSASYVQQSFVLDSLGSPLRAEMPSLPPSPLPRLSTLELQRGHPHARKTSAMDGSQNDSILSISTSPHGIEVINGIPTTHTRLASPLVPSSATSSTFSSSLDPISESSSPPTSSSLQTPLATHTSTFAHQQLEHQPLPNSINRKLVPPPLGIGLGQASPLTPTKTPHSPTSSRHRASHSVSAYSFPSNQPTKPPLPSLVSPQRHTELILYAYAQLSGFFTLTPPNSYKNTEPLRLLRRSLLSGRGGVVGGGSMDISSSSVGHGRRRSKGHSRSSSFSGAILGLVNAATGLDVTGASDAAVAASSGGGGVLSPSSSGTFEIDETEPLPTIKTQPSVFGVDLLLTPGESRSFTYTYNLPSNLPPTFKGKYFKFSYELVVGVSRSTSSSSPESTTTTSSFGFGSRTPGGGGGGGGGGQVSRMMKVPVRLYNNVVVNKLPQTYDLISPLHPSSSLGLFQSPSSPFLHKGRNHSQSSIVSLPTTLPSYSGLSGGGGVAGGMKGEIVDITSIKRLGEVASMNRKKNKDKDKDQGIKRKVSIPTAPSLGLAMKEARELDMLTSYGRSLLSGTSRFQAPYEEEEEEEELETKDEPTGGVSGCREAVEILTRVLKKATYDITHQNKHIATLSLIKGSYRLGETVQGVLEMNERRGWGRCLMMTVSLESTESLPCSLLCPTLPPSDIMGGLRSPPKSPSLFSPSSMATTMTTIKPLSPSITIPSHSFSSALEINPTLLKTEQQRTKSRKTHASTSSRYLGDGTRVPFGLDIPSDGTPGFGVACSVGGGGEGMTPNGGLEWSLKVSLLVIVAPGSNVDIDDGHEGEAGEGDSEVKFKMLERDGERGEWGCAWKVGKLKVLGPVQQNVVDPTSPATQGSKGWGGWLFGSSSPQKIEGGGDYDEGGDSDEDERKSTLSDWEGQGGEASYDGIKSNLAGGVGEPINFDGEPVFGVGDPTKPYAQRHQHRPKWLTPKLDTVEFSVPIRVWPGNTAFKAPEVVWEV